MQFRCSIENLLNGENEASFHRWLSLLSWQTGQHLDLDTLNLHFSKQHQRIKPLRISPAEQVTPPLVPLAPLIVSLVFLVPESASPHQLHCLLMCLTVTLIMIHSLMCLQHRFPVLLLHQIIKR